MKVLCIGCSGYRNHAILQEEIKDFYDEETAWSEVKKYQIIQCLGCDEITFRRTYSNINGQLFGGDEEVETLYPHRTISSRSISGNKNLPFNLTNIYKETIEAFNNNQFILCSAGLRALIEGICLEKGIQGKEFTTKKGETKISTNLEGKIDALAISNYLTNDNCKALHELRFLGNQALHELNQPSAEELGIALDIIDVTLTNIYEIEPKVKRLRESILSRSGD